MMSIPIEMIIRESEAERRQAATLQKAGFYWRERDGVRALICAPLEADGFTNAFSTRLGGVSPMPGNDLNLAGFNEDDAENIYENRRRFLKLFAGDWLLAGCWQVHGVDIRVVHSGDDARTKPGVLGDDQYCDALVSSTPHVLLAVKTADCVPILIGDPSSRAFAAVHAGWRGTSASIVKQAVSKLQTEFGAGVQEMRAAIGPAANGCCYEVGADVINVFKERFPASSKLFTPTSEAHARIDLHQANRDQLLAAGLSPDRIHLAPLCTMDRNELFFSYRQEKQKHGRVGRLMSVIGTR
jgi:purine-nucleoside/S-methyl-5'-thioadenosine phosphorylase / adenosine deaminase